MDFLAGIYLGGLLQFFWAMFQLVPEHAANTGRSRPDQVVVVLLAALFWPVWLGFELARFVGNGGWLEGDEEG